ncbi:hypothetical protein [Nocardia miyunensis]|uniref:hypothetical protein n=1 Tax=Nocardia miyunensis TaxID=282684 RepID=UPI00082B6236|nr:hypothetical protein [Nocardia miyunensis]
MRTVDVAKDEAPVIAEADLDTTESDTGIAQADPEPESDAPQPHTGRRYLAIRIAAGLLSLIFVAGCVAGGWSMSGHHTVVRNNDHDQQIMQFSMDAVAQLISTDSADAGGYVDRVLANSTGQWHDEFDARKRSVLDTMQASGGVSTGHGVAAGIERHNRDGSITVMVVATSQTSVPLPQSNQAPGPDQASHSLALPNGVQVKTEPKQYQLRVDITEVGGKYKLSKVGFVQ